MLGELARAALLGTERGELRWPEAEGPLGDLAHWLEGEEVETRFLVLAAAASSYAEAGFLPATHPPGTRPPVCDPETLPACTPAAAALLRRILDAQEVLLGQWLRLASAAGVRAPHDELPRLLGHGARSKALREPLAGVMGERGRWLARQNPQWSFALGLDGKNLEESVWHEGRTAERRAYVRALRRRDPGAARQLLTTAFEVENAATRSELLAALEVGLTLDDEPFLEGCLDDRSKQVRGVAVGLLGQLPASRRGERMKERLRTSVRLERKVIRRSLEIEPPEKLDEAMLRDGLREKVGSGGRLGKAAWRLKELVAATPADFWHQELELEPADLLRTLAKHPWREAMLDGLTAAALAEGHGAMAKALLEEDEGRVDELFAVLPKPSRDSFLIARLGAKAAEDARPWLYRAALEGPWSPKLSAAVLTTYRALVAKKLKEKKPMTDWQLRNFFVSLGEHVAVENAAEALGGWPTGHERWSYFVEKHAEFTLILNLRQQMTEELAP